LIQNKLNFGTFADRVGKEKKDIFTVNVIQPNCRVRFTAADIEFILSVLGSGPGKVESLTRLLADPESRDTILDDESLFRAILERSGCLRVSTHFYFYVLVRHVLRRAGIEDRAVADYVAEMLAEFSSAERARRPIATDPHPMDYLVDMLAALHTADDQSRFLIRAHVGNHSLFLSGVFPDRIRFQAQIHAAPEMRYYEELGSSNYRVAGEHPLAKRYELAPIFHVLAEGFHNTRLALNDMSDRLILIVEPEGLNELLIKQT